MASPTAPTRPGELLSERIAGGILPKVLGPFDMVAIFVAIVLFANQGSVIQAAGASIGPSWRVRRRSASWAKSSASETLPSIR